MSAVLEHEKVQTKGIKEAYRPPSSLPIHELRIDGPPPPSMATQVAEHNKHVEQLDRDFHLALVPKDVDLFAVSMAELVSEKNQARQQLLTSLQQCYAVALSAADLCVDCSKAWQARYDELQGEVEETKAKVAKQLRKTYPHEDDKPFCGRCNVAPEVVAKVNETNAARRAITDFMHQSSARKAAANAIVDELQRYTEYLRS